MSSPIIRQSGLALLLSLCTLPCEAATLVPVGVLGNSGESGEGLVRVGSLAFDHSATGIALDRDGALWAGAGDAINQLSLDGHLIQRFPLDPPGSSVDSRAFAVVDDTLYFLGHRPDGTIALFGLAMRGTEPDRIAQPTPTKLPERLRDWMPYCLAAQPLNGKLVLIAERKDGPRRLGVYLVDPRAEGTPEPAFVLPAEYPGGVACDPDRGILYVGAFFPECAGNEAAAGAYAIQAVRPDGAPVSAAFPVACPKTPAIPTQFRGFLSLAGGALWDTAWYGFLARLNLQGEGDPGRVIEWHHELGYPTQVLDLSGGAGRDNQLLAITTAMPEALYLARWEQRRQSFSLVSRLGCLPVISSLGLSDEGLVTVGTGRTQLWWRWEDAALAPPSKAELHIAVTALHFRQGRGLAMAAQYRLDDLQKRNAVPTVFSPVVGARNEANRVGDPAPMKQPIGLAVQARPGDHHGKVFVSDAETRQLWETEIWLPDLRPDGDKWRPVPTTEPLRGPTDVIALNDGRLLVADEGRILTLRPGEGGLIGEHVFERWGEGPQDHFGNRLRVAADGAWLLVADADRHRVLLVDWQRWQVLARLGETDKPGDDALHLNAPQQVALRGERAVIADAGNQRVMRVLVRP